jgi:integrase
VHGVETDEPLLSAHGLLNIYKTTHAAMEAAREKLSINHRFSRKLLRPPIPEEVRTTSEVVEAGDHLKRLFRERLSKDDFRYDQFLIAFMGLRAGERLGLTLDSVIGLDGKSPKLIIRTQQSYTKDRGVYLKMQTKSKKSRTVPLKKEFVPSIRRLRDRRLALENDPNFKPDRRLARCLFLREDGSIITTRQDTRIWRALLKEFDIPFFPQHSIRSVAATTYAEQGVPTETVGLILGHQSIAMTRYYARETEERTEREMDDVDFFA